MTITPLPLNQYPRRTFPVTNITPFTYRDGLTYLEKLECLRDYVHNTLVDWLNTNVSGLEDSWNEEVTNLVASVDAALAAQTTANAAAIQVLSDYVDSKVAEIVASSIEVSDPVIVGVLNNLTSATRELLDSIYTSKAEFDTTKTDLEAADTAFNELINTGRLSQGNLDADYSLYRKVSSYGAIGDGVVDDTAAIQNAFNAGYGTVIFDKETYLISGSITVPDKVNVISVNGKTNIIQSAVNTVAMIVTSSYCVISGISFTGRGAAGYNATTESNEILLQLLNSDNVKIENCNFYNIACAGIKVTDSSNIDIDNVTCVGPGTPTIVNNDRVCWGIYIDESINLKISNCDISDVCQGIIASVNTTHLSINDNKIHDIPGQHAVYTQNGTALNINDNDIWNMAYNGIKTQLYVTNTVDSNGLNISNNNILNCGNYAIILDNTDPLITAKFNSIIINNNNLVNNNAGIYAKCVRTGSINDNSIINSATQAIVLNDCWDVIISNANINKCGTNGVRFGATIGSNQRILFSDSRIRNAGNNNVVSALYGIQVDNGSDITFDGLIITADNTYLTYGIFLATGDQASTSIRNCQLSGDKGVSVRGVAGTLKEWTNNRLTGSIQNITGITFTAAPPAGAAAALPATPLGYYIVNIAGIDRKVAYYSV